MIFYFSGTGNSAWAARQIADAAGEELCDIGSLIREGALWEDPVESAVFVTPTYAWRIPRLVEDWIRRSSFGKAAAWFVMTCGDSVGSAGRFNRALSEEKGMRYMGTGKLVMPENYTAMFKT
ncbi:MAG: flavodoxin family protein, partial [Lachnospiraceae bacterium]|nr:flavodoxin family protein [Lachnospiraceae bacterium]